MKNKYSTAMMLCGFDIPRMYTPNYLKYLVQEKNIFIISLSPLWEPTMLP